MAVSPEGRPWSRLWRSSHSLTKPHSGGRAQMARPATRKTGALQRQPPQQAAEPVQVAQPGRLLERAGREEQRALEDGVEDDVQEGGDQGDDRQRAVPGGGEQARGPDAEQASDPTLSVVEYASRRLRSVLVEECRAPKRADSPPSAMTRSHHHAGPPPSKVSPTRMMP